MNSTWALVKWTGAQQVIGSRTYYRQQEQESCTIAKMTARCADKSKQTATPPPKITWLSVDSIQPDVMDVGVERTFSSKTFSMFPWVTKSEDAGLIVRGISFQDFQPMWSWSTNVTDRQTDGRTDKRTDDMRSQDRALHYSASRGKNKTSDQSHLAVGRIAATLPWVGKFWRQWLASRKTCRQHTEKSRRHPLKVPIQVEILTTI